MYMQAMMITVSPFGKWLADRISERGVTQGQVAAYVGVEDSTVARWKSGSRRPTVENCYSIAAYFRRPVQEVLQLNDYPTESNESLESFALRAEAARAIRLLEEGLQLLRSINERLAQQEPPESS